MAWLGIFTYDASVTEDGILLSDLFGKKVVYWKDIVSASTSLLNDDFWAYRICTDKNCYTVRPHGEDFEKKLIHNANLEQYGIHKWNPELKKRWKKIGLPYKFTDIFDRIDNIFFNYTK